MLKKSSDVPWAIYTLLNIPRDTYQILFRAVELWYAAKYRGLMWWLHKHLLVYTYRFFFFDVYNNVSQITIKVGFNVNKIQFSSYSTLSLIIFWWNFPQILISFTIFRNWKPQKWGKNVNYITLTIVKDNICENIACV